MAERSPERQKQYQVVKAFKALNTKADRTAIDEDEFSWIENVQPVGFGNLRCVKAQTVVNGVTWGAPVAALDSWNIGGYDYIIAFCTDGRAEYYNIDTTTHGTIAAASTFSTAGVTSVQWKNELIVIADPKKGLSSWDGTNLVKIGCIGPIGLVSPGSGYTEAPSVFISAPNDTNGEQATATVSITDASGTIVNINITNPGSGFTSFPIVTIDPPTNDFGTQAQASVSSMSGGSVIAITITNYGSGYTSAPSMSITGGGGSGCTATTVLGSGQVSAITITNPGSGYTAQPTVTVSGGGGSGCTTVGGFVTFAVGSIGILVTNVGSGYTSTPTVTVSAAPAGGTTATAYAVVIGGILTEIIVENPGAGYVTAPTVTISGGGGASAAAIAVLTSDPIAGLASFSGRIWLAQGRTIFYSSPNYYNDFITVAAGNVEISDSTLHSNITALISANNFMYVFGNDSVNVISDVNVQSSGVTTFTNTNVSASIGSIRPNSIFPYFRTLLFMNDYGIYALVGATTTKISDALDGIFPYIDFTKPVSGGQALLNNILCAAFNFTYNDPLTSARQVQAVFFDKKWFITSQGALTQITSVPRSGTISIYGTTGTDLVQAYASGTTPVSTEVQSALWPLSDPIRTKQALKFAFEASVQSAATFTGTIDCETRSSPTYTFQNEVVWINSINSPVPWTNNSGNFVVWYNSGNLGGNGYTLYKSDAQQYGKYLGMTLRSTSPGFTINTLELEYEMGVRF